MRYEILEHPAELRIKVYGKTLEELFSNAVFAMAEILLKESKIKNQESGKNERVKIKSVDINSLLVDFLSEILTKSQINKSIYLIEKIILKCHPDLPAGGEGSHRGSSLRQSGAQNDEEDGKCFLEAELIGYPVGKFEEDIKAVTYEDLDIKKVDDSLQTMIVFDI